MIKKETSKIFGGFFCFSKNIISFISRKIIVMRKLLLSLVSMISIGLAAQTSVYSWGFDAAFGTDWNITNQSTPLGSALWQKANYGATMPTVFSGGMGHQGGADSFALVNYHSTTGAGIISNWLITPVINVQDGDVVSFYTRKGTDGTTDYPDRLELRMSTAGTHVVPSGGASDVGSFTTVGVTVNPNLAQGFVYPQAWTQYQFTVSGVGTSPVPARFAFRYFITDGGPSGNNSDLIGIDTFEITRAAMSTVEIAEASKFKLYPNPATDVINISVDSKIKSAAVYDMSGKMMKVKFEEGAANIRHLAPGVYTIQLETEAGKIVDRFIKK